VRESHKKTIDHVITRTGISKKQIKDLSMLMASQFGPITVSSLIENGLHEFRKKRRKKK
jgi:hypothetical protein